MTDGQTIVYHYLPPAAIEIEGDVILTIRVHHGVTTPVLRVNQSVGGGKCVGRGRE